MNVLIVESAAKGRTLQRYLGDGWKVLATGGHVETLPFDRTQHGKDATKAFWANRPGELPAPPWVWTDRGEAAVQAVLDEAGPDPTFWIATDPDREGEFIAWCLDRLLSAHGPTHRVSFQEVTDEAVRRALENPGPVDGGKVAGALVRKFLDRLVGFRTSKMASSVVGTGASMGRVQTPTLGFVVERELEREAHVPIPYFEVRARAEAVEFSVRFHERDDPEAWRDEAGRVDPSRTFDGAAAGAAHAALGEAGRLTLTTAKESSRQRKSAAPFSTDALLQVAGSRFGWSPGKTSALASKLYEEGHLTYIRTDSTRLAESAVASARALIARQWGDDHLGSGTPPGASSSGPVQDAHEAIRPTRLEVEEPAVDDVDARKLYRLVRAHTLASLMAPSQRTVVSLEATAEGLDRPLTGSVSWRTFAGWEAAYSEFLTPPATSPPEVSLEPGSVWAFDEPDDERDNPLLVEDETRPPARYRPHMLIKAMKDAGIGRPSTYARTVDKLAEREYLIEEEGALAPTDRGRAVWLQAAPLYAREADAEHEAAELFSPEFTAEMEARLDRIAAGEVPAPATWEAWRDQIRDLHAAAQEARRSGASTPKQHTLLLQLYENAPEGWSKLTHDEINALSWTDAQDLIGQLKEAGVHPAPSEKQRAYLERLVADLELDAEALEEAIGVGDLDALADTIQASAAIDALQTLHDERRPPSVKQRRFVDDLVDESDLTPDEAAALVGASSLDELTGGRDGTASRLIDLLQSRQKEPASRA